MFLSVNAGMAFSIVVYLSSGVIGPHSDSMYVSVDDSFVDGHQVHIAEKGIVEEVFGFIHRWRLGERE